MGSSGVVLHVGSHMGTGFETAVPQIAEAFKRALDSADAAPAGVEDCPILIENAAGTGGTIGRSLEEIEALIDACGGDERLGLCIDTQHLWASGVDYSTVAGTDKLINEIDSRIGIRRLRCFHLNDSKIELGGNRDRHANIDEGTIGTKGLAPLVGHPQIRDLPLLLEVPGSGEGPRAEDVVAARKVVRDGIILYNGVGPDEPDDFYVVTVIAKKVPAKKKKAAKKASTKKSAQASPAKKKAPAKKIVAKKPPTKKPLTKKPPTKKPLTKKPPTKKPLTKKPPTKKSATKKSSAKKTPAKKKSPAKKIVAKKPPTKKSAAKKAPAKKIVAKKPPAKKSTAKKSPAKKSAKKSAKRK
jgi:hypothetical protein